MTAAIPNTQADGNERPKHSHLRQDWRLTCEVDHAASPHCLDGTMDASDSESESRRFQSTSRQGTRVPLQVQSRYRQVNPACPFPAWVSPVIRPPSRQAVSTTRPGGLYPTRSTIDVVPLWLMQNSGCGKTHASASSTYGSSSYVRPTLSPPTRR